MAIKFVSNKTVPRTKYRVSDGRTFETPNEANSRQLDIDFAAWYADPENVLRDVSDSLMMKWLFDHKSDILEILK